MRCIQKSTFTFFAEHSNRMKRRESATNYARKEKEDRAGARGESLAFLAFHEHYQGQRDDDRSDYASDNCVR
jgi:hypothetical protein